MVRIERVANEAALSAPKGSSVTLACPSRDALYLTTAPTDGDYAVGGNGAGALFGVTGLLTGGRSEYRPRIDIE